MPCNAPAAAAAESRVECVTVAARRVTCGRAAPNVATVRNGSTPRIAIYVSNHSVSAALRKARSLVRVVAMVCSSITSFPNVWRPSGSGIGPTGRRCASTATCGTRSRWSSGVRHRSRCRSAGLSCSHPSPPIAHSTTAHSKGGAGSENAPPRWLSTNRMSVFRTCKNGARS